MVPSENRRPCPGFQVGAAAVGDSSTGDPRANGEPIPRGDSAVPGVTGSLADAGLTAEDAWANGLMSAGGVSADCPSSIGEPSMLGDEGLLLRGDAGASSSASINSGGKRSFVISAFRLGGEQGMSSELSAIGV